MAIDLLKEEEQPRKKRRSGANGEPRYEVEMYIPPEEREESARAKKKQRRQEARQEQRSARVQSKAVANPPIESDDGVDLSQRYVRRQRWLRRLRTTGSVILIALVLMAVGYGGYLLLTREAPPQQTPTQPLPQEPSEQIPTQPSEPTAPEPSEPTGPLPDTELAPLAGALITFRDTTEIFLVENNGELRRVNQEAVVFANGQRLSELSRRLIYLLPDRWQSIRRGSQEVSGQVDFDPRVLTTPELLPFIQESN